MSKLRSLDPYLITNSGGTKNYTLSRAIDVHIIAPTGGTVTIGAAMNFSTADTPKRGQELRFLYFGGVTSDTATGKTVSFFGTSMTNAQALLKAEIICFYDGSAWQVVMMMNLKADVAQFETAQFRDQSVTAAKIANYTITGTQMAPFAVQGSIMRSGAAGVWEQLIAKTAGYILIGNDADLRSRPMTGPVRIDGDGLTSIQNGVITPEMLAFSLVGENLEVNVTVPSADVLISNATPYLIIGAPGAGYGIEVISASQSIVYVSAAYATNTISQLLVDTATVPQMICNDILVSTVSRTVPMDRDFTIGASDTVIIANKGLYFKTKTGNPTAGDSNIIVKVRYRIIPMP